MTLEAHTPEGSAMNVLILLFSWFGLFAGQGLPPPASIGGDDCPTNGCGQNGTRMTGLVADVPGDVAAVTLPSGEVIVTVGGDCPRIGGCGLNGTQVIGLTVDLPDHLDAVTLPSGERVALR
jgi:hypothetical protein